jgi:hypothetical protein
MELHMSFHAFALTHSQEFGKKSQIKNQWIAQG